MKVLTIFIDMIRRNRLSLFHKHKSNNTPLDDFLISFGGTYYSNCFSPGPDTPRAIATYLTGYEPYANGCDTRLKWPQFFLNKELDTIFDLFSKNKYKINIFSAPNERKNGLFPEFTNNNNEIFNNKYNILEYLESIVMDKDHFIFVSIPDFHWLFDDFGYSTNGEKHAYIELAEILKSIFRMLNKDDFDHIFMFSDHGFKFGFEKYTQRNELLLNDDRTNVLLFHRYKNQHDLIENNKLCSLADFYATYQEILGLKINNGISFLTNVSRKYVLCEDHIDFTPSINQNLELWSLNNKEYIYVRSIASAILIDRAEGTMQEKIVDEYDNILKANTSFGVYFNEYTKIFSYKKNILTKSIYTSGKTRKERGKLLKYTYYLLDKWRYNN